MEMAVINDYNEDLIYMDLNNDGFFTKNESQTLQEFFTFTDSNKEKGQLHMILLPFPAKLAVTEGFPEILTSRN